jgi:lipoprotein signal peptidase
MLDRKKKVSLIIFINLLFFILDRFFKNLYFLVQRPTFLKFQENYYFLFIFEGKGFYFLTTLILIVLVFFILQISKKEKYQQVFALGLILVGGFSNFLDRAIHGFVIDYISFLNLWSFNLADVMISVGSLLFIWQLLKTKK